MANNDNISYIKQYQIPHQTSFDIIIDTFATELTEPHKLFAINEQGIERFAVYNYSKLFLNPDGIYNNRQTESSFNIDQKKLYFNLLIGGMYKFPNAPKSGIITFLYNMLINKKNILRVNNNGGTRIKYFLDIQTEYDSYCIENNLIRFSSKRSSDRRIIPKKPPSRVVKLYGQNLSRVRR